jgi:hypothetical protein
MHHPRFRNVCAAHLRVHCDCHGSFSELASALPKLHIIGEAGSHAPVPHPGGATYATLNVTSKVFTAIKTYGQFAEFATSAVFQKGQFVTFDTVYNKQGVPQYRFIRLQANGSFVPVDFVGGAAFHLSVIANYPPGSRQLIIVRRSVDSITIGLVAVLQSDSTDEFVAVTISDAGLSEPAVSYPCCSVTPTGFAYNSADGVYFADMFDAPSLHHHFSIFMLNFPSPMQ